MRATLSWIGGVLIVVGLVLYFVGCQVEKNQRDSEAARMKVEQDGWTAAMEGAPPETCPWSYGGDYRDWWMKGYRKGLLERKERKPEAEIAPR